MGARLVVVTTAPTFSRLMPARLPAGGPVGRPRPPPRLRLAGTGLSRADRPAAPGRTARSSDGGRKFPPARRPDADRVADHRARPACLPETVCDAECRDSAFITTVR